MWTAGRETGALVSFLHAELHVKLTVPSTRQPTWPAILFAAGALAGCGAHGGGPTTLQSLPDAPLDVSFEVTDLEEGQGPPVENGWLLAAGFTGWLYDQAAPQNRGRVFASEAAALPFSFRLGIGQVIPGIDQGMVGMRVGGRRRIVIPPSLGFGAQGTNQVPGNATLIYEVELVAGAEVPFETIDLWVGEGEEVVYGDSLLVAYQGWVFDLLNRDNEGETFDGANAEDPFSFTLGAGEMVAGWDLGIVGMRVGGVRRIVIPHDLAYGAASRPNIPPYSTLLFYVNVLAIN